MTTIMSVEQVGELLKVAQRFDGRTIAEGNIEGWLLALAGLTYRECTAALIQHYANETAFAMPAHLRRIVNASRDAERPRTADTESHCGRPSCQCTHTAPCEYGWVPSKTVVDSVAPCPTCKPGRQGQPGETRQQWMARLQRQDIHWLREKRKKYGPDWMPSNEEPPGGWTPHAAAEGN
jgi:hypothetical protein